MRSDIGRDGVVGRGVASGGVASRVASGGVARRATARQSSLGLVDEVRHNGWMVSAL